MSNPVVSREEWLRARAELLTREKAFTRDRAALAERRRRLPWVRIEKEYVLVGPTGEVSLAEAFLNRSQLAVYHLMFGPGWKEPCSGCAQWANALDGTTGAFKAADARLIAVSRAPIEEIEVQRERRGWQFSWLSSFASDFNLDFYASSADLSDSSSKRIGGAADGEEVHFDRGENHGVSVFYRNEAGEIFHTYSAYNRGIEELNGAFGYFDLLPKGRAW